MSPVDSFFSTSSLCCADILYQDSFIIVEAITLALTEKQYITILDGCFCLSISVFNKCDLDFKCAVPVRYVGVWMLSLFVMCVWMFFCVYFFQF